jgi:hypothetical protein
LFSFFFSILFSFFPFFCFIFKIWTYFDFLQNIKYVQIFQILFRFLNFCSDFVFYLNFEFSHWINTNFCLDFQFVKISNFLKFLILFIFSY